MKAITANRLTDGRVVYWDEDDNWTDDLNDAASFADDAAADQDLTRAARDAHLVVGPYLMDVEDQSPSGRKTIRERIRLSGPSAGSLHTGLADT